MPRPLVTSLSIDDYRRAGVRDNTRRTYRSALRHFEVIWGGRLPCTPHQVATYLQSIGGTVSVSTVTTRCAALRRWHADHGFPDPTRSPLVAEVLRGMKEVHSSPPKKARSLALSELAQVSEHLSRVQAALPFGHPDKLRASRNLALVLVGFWRAFRSDEIARLTVEGFQDTHERATLWLPRTKTLRESTEFYLPALPALCPVQALRGWLAEYGQTSGPLFPGLSNRDTRYPPLHINAILPLLRSIFRDAGLERPEEFSTHSLRRGFVAWADREGWSIQQIQAYVGWKTVNTAARYTTPTLPSFSSLSLSRVDAP